MNGDKIMALIALHDRHMRGDVLTSEELAKLTAWLRAKLMRATLLGDGNEEEYLTSILNGIEL
jgi:NAD-specific glutamate dehydrogenase